MSAPTTARRPTSAPATRTVATRATAFFGYDGCLAAILVKVFQFFLVSVSFLACAAPAIVFEMLVGWQGTHLALWLGAMSLLPIAPGTHATLTAARGALIVRGGAGGGRMFWRSFTVAARSRWWLAVAVSAGVLVLGYDVAILGGPGALLIAVAGAAVLVVVVIAVACIEVSAENAPITVVLAAVTSIARRPHIALTWLFLVALGALATAIPVVGASAALFVPAIVASAIAICNASAGFRIDRKESVS